MDCLGWAHPGEEHEIVLKDGLPGVRGGGQNGGGGHWARWDLGPSLSLILQGSSGV